MFKEIPISKASKAIRSTVHGIGINDATYITSGKNEEGKTVMCPYYKVWASMLARCYSPSLVKRRPTYAACTLEESWKSFTAFKTWMLSQDWVGKVLDKDLLVQGNKHYGPNTCVFVTKELNNLLTVRTNQRGPYPLGVSSTITHGHQYYVASCSFYGKQKRLGYFKTVQEAADAYKSAKLKYIKELASKEPNPILKQALLNIS